MDKIDRIWIDNFEFVKHQKAVAQFFAKTTSVVELQFRSHQKDESTQLFNG